MASKGPTSMASAASNGGTKLHKSAKKLIEKFVKLTVHTYVYNSLTYFLNMKEKGNDRKRKLSVFAEFIGKIREMTSGKLIFGGFKQFGTNVR